MLNFHSRQQGPHYLKAGATVLLATGCTVLTAVRRDEAPEKNSEFLHRSGLVIL